MTTVCTIAACGDGHVQTGVEECNDGNELDDDACLNETCTTAVCGDGATYEGVEECDDGKNGGGDGCDDECVAEPDPQCSMAYTTLDDATRHEDYNGGGVTCDDAMGGSWYRFSGASGTKMPTMAPAWESCGTWGPGWLDGEYPEVADQKVARKVCFLWKDQNCAYDVDVDVVNCDDFYLFRLPNVPQCEMRYCGAD